jgi:pilus assembly protein CpaB
MGKFRPVILLGAAVIIALITTYLIYSSIQKRAGVAKAPILETQPIAIATVDLKWGTVVVKEMVKMEEFLKSTLPAGAYTDMNSLVGRVVISSIRAKEPFLESRLAPQSLKTGGVAAVISSNKRAVAVRVDKVIGVAGFVYPGNRVDVLVTMAKDKGGEPITKTVLENILVLAAGPEVTTVKGKEQQPATVDVITLEVTPEEAEKLALAATAGKLQLALRGLTDTEEVLTQGVMTPALLASYSGIGPIAKPTGKAVSPARRTMQPIKKVFYVELIQGGKVITKKFEEGK